MKPKSLTLQQVNEMIPKMPFNHHLGMRAVRRHTDGLTLECAFRDDLTNGLGSLHGGVTATLIDAAVGISVIGQLGGVRPVTTVEMKVSYLRPVTHGKVRCRARLLKLGKTLAVASADVHDQHGGQVATALVTYMLL